jgi:hypothetical protein
MKLMNAAIVRPPKLIGYRGIALILWGTMFALIGLGTYLNPNPNPTQAADLWHLTLPIMFRALMWSAPGLFAVIIAFTGREVIKVVGFVLLSFAPIVLMTSFAIAMVTPFNPARLTGFAVYLLLVLALLHQAAWPEPPTPTAESPRTIAGEFSGKITGEIDEERGDG